MSGRLQYDKSISCPATARGLGRITEVGGSGGLFDCPLDHHRRNFKWSSPLPGLSSLNTATGR